MMYSIKTRKIRRNKIRLHKGSVREHQERGSDQVRDWIKNSVLKDYGLSSTVRSIKSFSKVSSRCVYGILLERVVYIAPEKFFPFSFVHLSPLHFWINQPAISFSTSLFSLLKVKQNFNLTRHELVLTVRLILIQRQLILILILRVGGGSYTQPS
uniref:Uncharacterized protein n=1 Tax=Vicia faba TaxID=3906 RepID=R4IUC6_VICFA|nr:hypothetical protein [Vicia faba]AGC79000.1 hypothetical protein [Vicia faba]